MFHYLQAYSYGFSHFGTCTTPSIIRHVKRVRAFSRWSKTKISVLAIIMWLHEELHRNCRQLRHETQFQKEFLGHKQQEQTQQPSPLDQHCLLIYLLTDVPLLSDGFQITRRIERRLKGKLTDRVNSHKHTVRNAKPECVSHGSFSIRIQALLFLWDKTSGGRGFIRKLNEPIETWQPVLHTISWYSLPKNSGSTHLYTFRFKRDENLSYNTIAHVGGTNISLTDL